jgi:hypothetical protein
MASTVPIGNRTLSPSYQASQILHIAFVVAPLPDPDVLAERASYAARRGRRQRGDPRPTAEPSSPVSQLSNNGPSVPVNGMVITWPAPDPRGGSGRCACACLEASCGILKN